MKRKILAATLCAVTAATCSIGFSACNKAPEQTAFEKAFLLFSETPNMTITVTDSRIQKDGGDLSALVEVDHSHNTIYCKWDVFERYSQIFYDNGTITTTEYYKDGNEWRSVDLVKEYVTTEQKDAVEIGELTQLAAGFLPIDNHSSMAFCENEDDETVCASIAFLPEIFTQDGNVFTSELFSCILYESDYIRFACTITVTLDTQGRFANVVLDYGDNGTITTEYTYGTANVIVPEH